MFDDKPLQEKCGIVGIFAQSYAHKLPLALLAATGVQHRGQHGAGVVIKTKKSFLKHTDKGLLGDIFTPDKIAKLNKSCQWILVHCRYGTFGGYIKENLQPCTIRTKQGDEIAVVHNGEFAGVEKFKKKVSGHLPDGASDTYIFTQYLAELPGDNWDEKIKLAISEMTGAYSLIIGVNDTLYVVRDDQGIRPLFLGQLKNGVGGWMIGSETHAFDKAGVKVQREIHRGEIIKLSRDGKQILKKGLPGLGHFCDFEWAYFSRPNSLYPLYEKGDDGEHPERWLSVTAFRERCGMILAQEKPIKKATVVVGIPDSGVNLAIGYANTLRLPYHQVIIRDHFDSYGNQRLFMRDDEMKKIKTKVLGKLSFVPDPKIWKDAIVVLGDDSIVRGTVSEKITQAVYKMGASEVHWIVGFPAVAYPCHLGVSMRSGEELIGCRYKSDPKKIARALGATSVNYISHRGFLRARYMGDKSLHPRDKKEMFLRNFGCAGCVTGVYPVSREGTVYKTE